MNRSAPQLTVVAIAAALAILLGAPLATRRPTSYPAAEASRLVVDVNHASAAELALLPRVGPQLAQAIVEARRSRQFESLADLAEVSGVGPATLQELREHVRFGPPSPPTRPSSVP